MRKVARVEKLLLEARLYLWSRAHSYCVIVSRSMVTPLKIKSFRGCDVSGGMCQSLQQNLTYYVFNKKLYHVAQDCEHRSLHSNSHTFYHKLSPNYSTFAQVWSVVEQDQGVEAATNKIGRPCPFEGIGMISDKTFRLNPTQFVVSMVDQAQGQKD